MDTPAHVVPVVGDRPNGPFHALGTGLPWRGMYLRRGDYGTGSGADSQRHTPIQGFRRLPSCRTVSRSSMLRSR